MHLQIEIVASVNFFTLCFLIIMMSSIMILFNANSKEQIGMPTDFKHITHVGFDPDKGFSQFNMDEKLQGFFNMVSE